MFANVFENRGKWQKWCGAGSPVPECPGRRLCHNQLQLLRRNDHLTVVATEPWRRCCLLAYTELRDEEERKSKRHNQQKRTSQLPAHHSFPAPRLCHLLLCCRDTVLPQPSGACAQTLKLKGITSSHSCLSIFVCLSHQTDDVSF